VADRGKPWLYTLLGERGVPNRSGKKYHFDDTILDTDSPTKFYLLGLFAADGTVGKNRDSKYIDISLHKKDGVLLEDIRKVFKTNKPLYVDRNQLRFTLYSEKLFDLMSGWGIGPRKSLTLEIAKEIPLEFLPDFLRGVFDGDGSVTGKTVGKADLTFCMTGSEKFALQLGSFYKQLGHDVHLYKTRPSLWVLKRGGIPGLQILSGLYKRGELCLPRKHEKFLFFTRPTLDETMMETAYLFSKRSTCIRLKVGCVLTDEHRNNIISIGYNGGVAGLENYCESSLPGLCGCIHAEPGALIKGRGPLLYCTHLPCTRCAKLIINSGVKQVFYSEKYRNDYSLELFSRAGVKARRLRRDNYAWKLQFGTEVEEQHGKRIQITRVD
jgi:dCMP deaminase